MRLVNKKALITAAGQGIGRETALTFAKEGASVLATDINEDSLAQLDRGADNISIAFLDVSDSKAIYQLVQSQPAFDIIFNCAGYVANGALLECEKSEWQKSFLLNIDSMYHVCKSALPAMIDAGGGSIINMSSVASSLAGVPNRLAYSATKAAVIGLTKSIAIDYVDKGIRCNAICPGTIRTPSLEQRIAELPGDHKANWERFVSRQPMNRLGEPAEIAALAIYLASDESSFTTGAVHVIDGGWII